MDPVVIMMISKSALAGSLIAGGITALFIGKNLYLKGIGLQADGTEIETHKIKASLKTAGAVVMATSCVWGFLGYLASPSFSSGPEGKKVASFKLPNLDIKAMSFAYPVSEETAKKTLSDPIALKEVFALAYRKAQNEKPAVTVNNQPAMSKLQRITTLGTINDQVLVVGIVESGGRDVALTYKPKIKGENVLFMPQDIGLLEASPTIKRNDLKTPNKTFKLTP